MDGRNSMINVGIKSLTDDRMKVVIDRSFSTLSIDERELIFSLYEKDNRSLSVLTALSDGNGCEELKVLLSVSKLLLTQREINITPQLHFLKGLIGGLKKGVNYSGYQERLKILRNKLSNLGEVENLQNRFVKEIVILLQN